MIEGNNNKNNKIKSGSNIDVTEYDDGCSKSLITWINLEMSNK